MTDARLAYLWLLVSFVWLTGYAMNGDPMKLGLAIFYQVLALVSCLHGERSK